MLQGHGVRAVPQKMLGQVGWDRLSPSGPALLLLLLLLGELGISLPWGLGLEGCSAGQDRACPGHRGGWGKYVQSSHTAMRGRAALMRGGRRFIPPATLQL